MMQLSIYNFRKLIGNKLLSSTACFLLAIGAFKNNANASLLEPLKIGHWSGGSYMNDKTGKFSHCAFKTKIKDGMSLLFSTAPNQAWQLGFAKNGWDFTPDKNYSVTYQIDGRRAKMGHATARSEVVFIIAVPADTTIFSQMRTGRRLLIKFEDETISSKFKDGMIASKLIDANKVLDRLLECRKEFSDFVMEEEDAVATCRRMTPIITDKKANGLGSTFSELETNAPKVIKSCELAAKDHPNDPSIQLHLGGLYYAGKQFNQAAKWYQKAAEEGNAAAQFQIGHLYHHGKGVTKDLEMAVAWFRKSSLLGDGKAQFRLAVLYIQGEGVSKDLETAAQYMAGALRSDYKLALESMIKHHKYYSKEFRVELQNILRRSGAYSGVVDGIFDRETIVAMKRYAAVGNR